MKSSLRAFIPDKLVFGGQALAKKDGASYLLWNALPLEEVRARILKKHRSVYECVAEEILKASPERIRESEAHFLCCSPWQILSWEAENRWKEVIALETYRRIGKIDSLESLAIHSDPSKPFGYRNKMEYRFCRSNGVLSFALYERDTNIKVPIETCILAEPAVNRHALSVLQWLRVERISENCLESLVVRSDNTGHTLASLFLTEELGIKTHPPLDDYCVGFEIRSLKKRILGTGQDWLESSLLGTKLRFGFSSFFQIHTALFEQTLTDLEPHLDPAKKLVDFYSGVGTIGLSLQGNARGVTLVESYAEATRFASENIRLNGFENCRAHCSSAEKMTGAIESDCILVLDPPRAGLDEKVVRRILSAKPSRVLYLSCNPTTHARDIRLLSVAYQLKDLRLYNYFPRTPHIEALAVLER